jgi:hypothetical protein
MINLPYDSEDGITYKKATLKKAAFISYENKEGLLVKIESKCGGGYRKSIIDSLDNETGQIGNVIAYKNTNTTFKTSLGSHYNKIEKDKVKNLLSLNGQNSALDHDLIRKKHEKLDGVSNGGLKKA